MVERVQPGQVQPSNAPQVNFSSAAFGGASAAALDTVGRGVSSLGSSLDDIAQKEKQKTDAAAVMTAYSKASDELRTRLYDPNNGLFTRQGGNAQGVTEDVNKTSREVFDGAISGLSDPDQKTAFDQMWQRKHESTMDSASSYEFGQMQTYRTQAKTAALASVQADAVANYRNPAALAANVDAAKAMVRANPDGLPPEAVAGLERSTVSAMQVEVIRRLAADNPGDALDYYTAHRDEISGADHNAVQQIVAGVAEARQADAAVKEITDNGHAVSFTQTVYAGDPDAAPAMDMDPEIAMQVARDVGDTSMDGMDDKQAAAYLSSPAGRATSQRVATSYLGAQLKVFKGDLEASLIAVHESPEAATAFLNAGRDYSVLDDPDGTAKKVASEVQRFAAGPVRSMDSAGIQSALSGKSAATYSGDAQTFVGARFVPASADDKLTIDPQTASHLAAMISDAPEGISDNLKIIRGAGGVVDLGWQDGSFADAPPEAQQWILQNAARYGMGFPDGVAPWQIVDGATPSTTSAANTLGLPVSLSPETGRAADLYATPQGAYRLTGGPGGNLTDWNAAAEDRYKDNPALLAEVQRQLSNTFTAGKAATAADNSSFLREGFRRIIAGDKIADLDPQLLQEMGPDNVGKLLTLEGKFQKGGGDGQTDDVTYYKLTQMDPQEFAKADLIQYADKLSGPDFRALAEKQAGLNRPSGASELPGARTRTQIVENTVNMLGLNPGSNTNDAAQVNQLNRALDDRIASYVQDNKKGPNSVEVQKMVDDLVITGHQPSGGLWDELFGNHLFGIGSGGDQRAYTQTSEQLKTFVIADNFGEVPVEAHDVIAQGYRSIYGTNPGEPEATAYYNDMTRITLGATVSPPPALENDIAQALADRLKRRPTDDEIASAYTLMIKGASGIR